MQEIYFVTTNAGKVASLRRQLDPSRFTLSQADIEVPEIQAASGLEIAEHKATYAFGKLHKPLLVQDSAFHIAALSGFPGPYVKYVNETLGIDGLLKLMEGVRNRSAHFEHVLTYVDNNGAHHTFTARTVGVISGTVYAGHYNQSWSELWRIYIPKPGRKTLAELFENGQTEIKYSGGKSDVTKFIEWLDTRSD